MLQPVTLKKLKLKGFMKTYKTLELTPKKDVFFIIGDWNAKVGSQETPGVTGKFGLEVQNEAVQFSSVAQSCQTLCDPMNCSTPGLPVYHQLPGLTQTHVR